MGEPDVSDEQSEHAVDTTANAAAPDDAVEQPVFEIPGFETPAVELESVTVEFDDFIPVADASAAIERGKTTAIMGLSGSGKSTLLKVAAGLIPAAAGRVTILGVPIRPMSDGEMIELRRQVGFVFQEGALWQNMSIYRNIELPLEHQEPELTRQQRRDRIAAALAGFRFARDLSLRPSILSSGEAKVISFVRATVTKPELIFLDEPTTFVDRSNQTRMVERLRALKRDGRTLVIVTHNSKIAAQLADRVLVMADGAILGHGTLQQVAATDDERVREVLHEVLGDAIAYDEDLLSLLGSAEPI